MVFKLIFIIIKKTYKVLICSKRLYGTQRLSLGVALIITLAAATYILTKDDKPMSLFEAQVLVEDRLKEYYLEEKGKGCEIPKVDPFSAEAMKFNEDLPKITCKGSDWVICKKSECYVTKEVLKNMADVSCTYRDIVYVDDQLYFLTDYIKLSGGEKYTLNRSDHLKIACTGRYLNRHLHHKLVRITHSPNTTDINLYSDSILYSRWSGLKAGFRPVETTPVPPDRKDSYNVLLLAFDSASHSGFIRKMPKTFKFLADRAIILNGHNIVGEGTPAALYPLLTGLSEHEHPDARKKTTKKVYVDHELFLFHQLKKYGYRTAYFEDSPSSGTFQDRFNGFRQQPADHYLRAFLMENSNKRLSYISHNKFCVGATPQYQLFLNLTNEFFQFDDKKFCFTFIADICHDNFNQIDTADEAVVWLLNTLDARRVFEDTLVIVMGDHGPRQHFIQPILEQCPNRTKLLIDRHEFTTHKSKHFRLFKFSQIRETYQGKLEERLPLMAIFLPEKLKHLRPNALAALKQNIDVLTTPFDVHATLLDVLDLKHKSNKYKVPGSDLPRAMSLLEPIPKTRVCAEAGIVQHWCACTKWFNVSQRAPMYNRVANVLAWYIDSISEEQRSKCAKRQLISIESVLQHNVNNQLLTYGYKKDEDSYLGNSRLAAPRAVKEYYQAKIILNPGRGVFEGTLTYNTRNDSFTINHKDISRISKYGIEPNCIRATHPHLNPFCYCKYNLPTTGEIHLN